MREIVQLRLWLKVFLAGSFHFLSHLSFNCEISLTVTIRMSRIQLRNDFLW